MEENPETTNEDEFVWIDNRDLFVTLPAEVVLNIFGKLAVRDLGQAGLVCREWWAVSLEPSLWRSLFLEARRAGAVEKPARDSVSAPEDDSQGDDLADWKERYRTTYHFRKGIFLGDRKKNEITIRLDTAHFVADDPVLTLSGEVTLIVASKSITTNGLYVYFEAYERRFAPDEENEKKTALWSLHHPVTDDVPWDRRNTRKLVFPQGTHRMLFSVDFPRSAIPPSITRHILSIQYSIAYGMQGVIAYPWPFQDHWNPIALYPLTVLPSPLTRMSLMTAARNAPFEETFSRLGPGLHFSVSLPKSGFFFGEKIRMTITVRNGMPWAYEQITVRPIELMKWRGQAKWNSVEPSKAQIAARQQRQRHQQLRRLQSPRRSAPGAASHDKHSHNGDDADQALVDELLRAWTSLDSPVVDKSIAADGGGDASAAEALDVIRANPQAKRGRDDRKRTGEQVFDVVVPKHASRCVVLEFEVDESHLNPPPWCLPHTTEIEHMYALKIELRKQGLWAASTTEQAMTRSIVFDTPRLLRHQHNEP